MSWENIRFNARDVIMIVANVVTATSFVLIMKGDIHTLMNGLQRMEANQDKQAEEQKALRTQTEVQWTEMKVRVSILEQKVTDLQIERDANHN